MAHYFPLGGLADGDNVIIVYYDPTDTTFWVLTSIIPQPSAPPDLIFKNPIVITEAGTVTTDTTVIADVATWQLNITTTGSVQFLDSSQSDGLGVITMPVFGDVATRTSPAATISYSQSLVADWDNPPQLLTGVPYVLSASGTTSGTMNFLFDDGSVSGLVRSIFPYFVPATAYYACTSTLTNSSSNVSDILRTSYCSIIGALNTDVCPALPAASWTNASDCINGFVYRYAPIGVTCTSIYKSTCPSGSTCIYSDRIVEVPVRNQSLQGSNGARNVPVVDYQCQLNNNVNNPPIAGSPGLSVWAIVLIVIAAIVVIIFVLLIFRSIVGHNAKKDRGKGGDASDIPTVEGENGSGSGSGAGGGSAVVVTSPAPMGSPVRQVTVTQL